MRIGTRFTQVTIKAVDARKKYDRKVDIVSGKVRFDYLLTRENGVDLYRQVVCCKRFKRNIRSVILSAGQKHKAGHALLFSTDAALDPVIQNRAQCLHCSSGA